MERGAFETSKIMSYFGDVSTLLTNCPRHEWMGRLLGKRAANQQEKFRNTRELGGGGYVDLYSSATPPPFSVYRTLHWQFFFLSLERNERRGAYWWWNDRKFWRGALVGGELIRVKIARKGFPVNRLESVSKRWLWARIQALGTTSMVLIFWLGRSINWLDFHDQN